ncbi:hypothetical protein SDC9_06282 [bioreactor metagenome]|uniref:Uncharacterized protein n=1 Tax=bioreactor metagenome TaxID=1076179 RepID=A0A644T469_9ZZZZ
MPALRARPRRPRTPPAGVFFQGKAEGLFPGPKPHSAPCRRCRRRSFRRPHPGIGIDRLVAPVRHVPGDHLAGVQKPLRIRLALEGKLARVGRLPAALLERVAVRVEDHRAHLLVLAHDLLEPLLGGEAHHGQPRIDHLPMLTHHLEVLHQLRAETGADGLDHLEEIGAVIAHLQICDVGIDLQRAQRGVVPAVFIGDARAAAPVLRVRAEDHLPRRPAREEGLERGHRLRRDHQLKCVVALAHMALEALEVLGRDRRLADGDELDQDPVLGRKLGAETRRLGETGEGQHGRDPVIGRGERHLDLGDDAVRAIGVADPVQLLAGEFVDLRLGLHRDHAQSQDIAQIAQRAPADRAHPARAAGDETAKRRGGRGRGHHPQLLPGLRLRLRVEVADHDARFRHHPARSNLADPVHVLQVHHAAARQRHRLTVIAGAGAAHGNRHVMGVTGLEHLDHLGLVARRDDEIGHDVIEARLQHRRIPEEIPAFRADRGGVVVKLEMGERGLCGINVHVISPSSSE